MKKSFYNERFTFMVLHQIVLFSPVMSGKCNTTCMGVNLCQERCNCDIL